MIKYLHVRALNDENELSPNGGLTVAYTCTLTDIVLQVAKCHENDLFCHRIGREIAFGRLKSKKIEDVIIPLTHPVTQCIVDWISFEHFTVPIDIHLDAKHRWVSDFEPDDGVEVVTEDWRDQIPNEVFQDNMRYDG